MVLRRSGPLLRTSRVVRAPRERVFRAWTEPASIEHWFGRPEGANVTKAEVDLRVGGHYTIVIQVGPGDDFPVSGTYLEVDAPNRLVYTFRWERDLPLSGGPHTGETRVTAEFVDLGDSTEIVLTHEGLVNDESREFHNAGWGWGFDRLADLLS